MSSSGIVELHVHLEGSLPARRAIELARRIDHPWSRLTPAELRNRFRVRSFTDFLEVIKEMCLVLSTTDALRIASSDLSRFLATHGVRYAEVYFSPYVYQRWGVSFEESIGAVVDGFEEGQTSGGADCRILFDTVRQWGPEPAEWILDSHEKNPRDRVVGFGIGGDESVRLESFEDVFRRARDLGLRTTAHAGELGPPEDVRVALDVLGVDRIAHGIRCLEDPELTREIAERRVPLDLAITSNFRTGAARGLHPARQLVDAGAIITINTDDPGIFLTTPRREWARAARLADLRAEELDRIARDSIEASFAEAETKRELLRRLETD